MVLTDDRRLELRELPRPTIGPEDGLLRVEACGICGADVELFNGRSRDFIRYPVVPGHEPVGVLEEVGERAAARWGVRPGDRVAVEPFIPCGHCRLCLAGDYTNCTGWGQAVMAYACISQDVAPGLWGAYATHLYLHPNSVLHKVASDVPAEIAVMFNPLGNGIRWAVHVPQTQLGDTVVVLGSGQRGIAAAIAAKAAGAGTVIITDVSAARVKLELALELGADHAIDVEREDVVQRVKEITEGRLADVVVDVSAGATRPVVDAIEIVRPRGTVVLAGMKGGRVVPEFVSDRVVLKGIRLQGALGANRAAFAQAIRIIEGRRFPLHRLHTHDFPLSKSAEAIRVLAREIPGEDAIHVAIQPWQ